MFGAVCVFFFRFLVGWKIYSVEKYEIFCFFFNPYLYKKFKNIPRKVFLFFFYLCKFLSLPDQKTYVKIKASTFFFIPSPFQK